MRSVAFLRARLTYANVASTLALVAALGGGAVAAVRSIPGHDGVIHSCYSKKRGSLRVVPAGARCGRSERALAFNQTGPPGAPGIGGGPGPAGEPATKLFASVSHAGLINYGQGATAASRTAAGRYTVAFERDLTNCVGQATVGFGNPVFGGDAAAGGTVPVVLMGSGNPHNAEVLIYQGGTTSGTTQDSAFMLTVFC